MNILNKIIYYWHRRNGNAFISYLRDRGIIIGNGTLAKSPLTIQIDISRPALLTIGKNVLLHKGLTILTHDYASRVFVNKYGDFIPSHGKVSIGNNVWFGENCTVLKGVTIGDNCIIGYGSTVIKDIPENSVAVGSPAKVICSLDKYYEKRKSVFVTEVLEYAWCIEKRLKRKPVIDDFKDDYPAFVDNRNYKEYNFPYSIVFTDGESFNKWLSIHRAPYNGFEEFMAEYEKYKIKYK